MTNNHEEPPSNLPREEEDLPDVDETLPKDESLPNLPAVVQRVDRGQLRHFVTTIKSAEHQVGEHIIAALNDDQTVAVLTTVVIGPDGMQRIVSAALSPELMMEVQKLLGDAEKQREEEIPCVGFHCYIKPKSNGPPQKKKKKKKDHRDTESTEGAQRANKETRT